MAKLNKSALSKALTLLSGLLPARPITTVAGAVLLTPLDKTRLEVSARGPHFYARAVIQGKITDFPTPIGVLPRFLGELLAALPEDGVDLAVDPQTVNLTVACGKHQAHVKGLEAKDFLPFTTTPPTAGTFLIEPTAAQRIAKVIPAALDERADIAPGQKQLTRVRLDLVDGRLRLVATDGYRMSVVHTEVSGADLSATVPQDMLALLCRAVKALAPTQIKVYTEEWAGFWMEGQGQIELLEYYVRNDAQSYPDVSSFINLPANYPLKALVSGSDLRRCLRQTISFAAPHVKITARPDELVVTSPGESYGDAESHLEAMFPVEGELTVMCGPQYLRDALAVLDGNGVMLAVRDPFKPILLYPPHGPDELHIIMPMHPPR